MVVGVLSSVGGVATSFYADTPSGGTIVLIAIAIFLASAATAGLRGRLQAHRHREAERHDHEHGSGCGHPAVPHQDHLDYLHDGHLHAPHGGHYDEHDAAAHAAAGRGSDTPGRD